MTIEQAILFSPTKYERYDYPSIIDSSAGLYTIPELNCIGISSWDRNNPKNKRKVVLEITTYKGIAANAIHFYGKLIVDGVYTATIDNPEKCTNLRDEQEKLHPLMNYQYHFDIKRPITQEELQDPKQIWYAYCENDVTERFNSIPELIEHTLQIIKLRFTGEWTYIVQYPRGQTEELVLI